MVTHFLGDDEVHKLLLALVASRGVVASRRLVVLLISHPSIFLDLFSHKSLIQESCAFELW